MLSVGEDKFYYLPNVKNTLLSRYLGKTVRVKGVQALSGDSIVVDTVEVMQDGSWSTFYSPQIRKMVIERYQLSPYHVH